MVLITLEDRAEAHRFKPGEQSVLTRLLGSASALMRAVTFIAWLES